MKKVMLIILAGAFLAGCGEQDQEQVSSSDVVETTEAAVNTLSAIIDDNEGESYALKAKPQKSLEEILFPKAYAANCIRPKNQACVNQQKVSVFDDCTIFGGRATINGSVTLDYSTR